MIYKGQNNEMLRLQTLVSGEPILFDASMPDTLTLLWIQDQSTLIDIDGEQIQLPIHSILCLTSFHDIRLHQMQKASVIQFNRAFYCVLHHDSEVSCRGVLFFGANQLPHFQIPESELEKFQTGWKMFELEMQSRDELQLEMLQAMLKRFIIWCTRLYKSQHQILKLKVNEVDLVRNFNFLVEQHFKEKHTVQEYAEILHKSPKTIANIFSKVSDKTPLQVIHERKLLEARRMLRFTDKSIKEISYELGFEDIQTFSRFFKKQVDVSPTEFKHQRLGTMDKPEGSLA